MQIGGNWSPMLFMESVYPATDLHGMVYRCVPFGITGKIKGYRWVINLCVMSVTVSPIILLQIRNVLFGRLFPWVFSTTSVARKILMESGAGTPVTIWSWFIFDYRNNSTCTYRLIAVVLILAGKYIFCQVVSISFWKHRKSVVHG